MTDAASPALLQAIALHRAPRGLRPRAAERLPEGVLQVIRIAAGEEAALARAQAASGEPADVLLEAARFYIQQVLFAPQADSFRVLGVGEDDSDEVMREHYRWLVRWLHPDRNPDQWEAFYADRVNRAWQDLRNPERRARYSQELTEGRDSDNSHPHVVAATAPMMRPARREEPAPKAMNLRWVPTALLGSLGLTAVALVGLFVALQFSAPPPNARVQVESAPAVETGPGPSSAESTPDVVEQPAAVDPLPAPIEVAQSTVPISPVLLPPESDAEAPMPPPRERVADSAPARSVMGARLPTSEPIVRRASSRSAPVEEVAIASAEPAYVSAQSIPEAPPSERAETATAARVDPGVANRMLGNFSSAYGRGDIDGMRRLFAEDVRSNRGGLREILADYEILFESSRDRALNVHNVSWFADGDTLTVVASFNATVSDGRERKARKTRGDLRFDLRKVNDEWRIYRFKHGERPG